MNLFFNPVFWGTAAAVYILLLFEIPRSLATRFGILNFFALIVLLGWQTALGAFSLTMSTWIILYLYKKSFNDKDHQAKNATGIGIVLAFTLLFIFHKWNHESTVLVSLLEKLIPWARPDIVFPILAALSFSYIYLRLIDLIISVVWKDMNLLNPFSLMGYLLPFHMLLAGPVNNYRKHLDIDEKVVVTHNFDHIMSAINEITTGLLYKFVIAEGIRVYINGINGTIGVSTLAETVFFVIYLFFDFAGYSKMARGIGYAYGVPTPQNFLLPFLSTSMTEFWSRWHISLGDFIRGILFTPMQIFLVRKYGIKWAHHSNLLTLIVSFSLVGIWHRLTWNYFLWGVAMGVIVALEKSIRDIALSKYQEPGSFLKLGHQILGPAYVFSIFTISIFYVANELTGK